MNVWLQPLIATGALALGIWLLHITPKSDDGFVKKTGKGQSTKLTLLSIKAMIASGALWRGW